MNHAAPKHSRLGGAIGKPAGSRFHLEFGTGGGAFLGEQLIHPGAEFSEYFGRYEPMQVHEAEVIERLRVCEGHTRILAPKIKKWFQVTFRATRSPAGMLD